MCFLSMRVAAAFSASRASRREDEELVKRYVFGLARISSSAMAQSGDKLPWPKLVCLVANQISSPKGVRQGAYRNVTSGSPGRRCDAASSGRHYLAIHGEL